MTFVHEWMSQHGTTTIESGCATMADPRKNDAWKNDAWKNRRELTCHSGNRRKNECLQSDMPQGQLPTSKKELCYLH